MHPKAALATAGALTATLFSGIVAVGATTGLLNAVEPSGPGHERLVDAASSARAKKILMIVDDPAPGGESSAQASGRGRTSGAKTAPKTWTTAAAPGSSPGAPRSGNGTPASTTARESTTTTRPKAPQPPPTTAAPPTTSGPYNCSGSDDGMSEAYKQAREAYCHGRAGDD